MSITSLFISVQRQEHDGGKCKEKKSESFTTCQIETKTSTTPGIAINPMVYRASIGLGLKHSEPNGEWPLNVI